MAKPQTILKRFDQKYNLYKKTNDKKLLKKLFDMVFDVFSVDHSKEVDIQCMEVMTDLYLENDRPEMLGDMILDYMMERGDEEYTSMKMRFCMGVAESYRESSMKPNEYGRATAYLALLLAEKSPEKAYYYATISQYDTYEPLAGYAMFKCLEKNYPIEYDTDLALAYMNNLVENVYDYPTMQHAHLFLELYNIYEDRQDDRYLPQMMRLADNAKIAYVEHDRYLQENNALLEFIEKLKAELFNRYTKSNYVEKDKYGEIVMPDDYYFYDKLSYEDREEEENDILLSVAQMLKDYEAGELEGDEFTAAMKLFSHLSEDEKEKIRELYDYLDEEEEEKDPSGMA